MKLTRKEIKKIRIFKMVSFFIYGQEYGMYTDST